MDKVLTAATELFTAVVAAFGPSGAAVAVTVVAAGLALWLFASDRAKRRAAEQAQAGHDRLVEHLQHELRAARIQVRELQGRTFEAAQLEVDQLYPAPEPVESSKSRSIWQLARWMGRS